MRKESPLKLRYILILLAVLIVLGGVYYYFFVFQHDTDTTPADYRVYLWDIESSDLAHILITLPREGKSMAFINISEENKFPWYFDDEQKSPVDAKRWGGGIPLLLSGPGADRVIVREATDEQLAVYGLTEPSMEIILTLENGDVLKIDVGDSTPDGSNYYIRPPDTNGVATVDYLWFDVISGLVTNPPYAPQTE